MPIGRALRSGLGREVAARPGPGRYDSWLQQVAGERLAEIDALRTLGAGFYGKLRERFRQHGRIPPADARVLDFGCGWGRLTRCLARDVAPGALCGCDVLLDELHQVMVTLRRH